MSAKRSDVTVNDGFMEEYESADDLAMVVEALPPAVAPSRIIDRVLSSTRASGRFARFVDATARLLDIPADSASNLLERLDEPTQWTMGFLPGMEVCHVDGGPLTSGAITGFVRLKAGTRFPEHRHLGQETIFILQGRCDDGGRIFGPGDEVFMETDTSHGFAVVPGPDLLYLAIVHGGLRIGEFVVTPENPLA